MNSFFKLTLIGIICFSATRLFAQDTSFTNFIGMRFVLIKPGSFILGSFQPPYPTPPGNKDSNAQTGNTPNFDAPAFGLAKKMAEQDALTGFTVTIRKPFYMGQFEVTQAQWQRVMGSNPSIFKENGLQAGGSNRPVENVSWNDVQLFLKKLNALEKGRIYRLPTEAEWEYAARAGAASDIPWQQIRKSAQLGTSTTNNVGGKTPNAWGLYDMLGNVWEWVADYYNEKIVADKLPPKTGKEHVLKGASFTGDVKNATYMTHAGGPGNGWDVGFRVVLEVKP